jgi:cytochrome b involved in lipid metabolism
MKIIIGISLFVFGVIVTAILTAGLVFYDKKNSVNLNNSLGENSALNNSTGTDLSLNNQEIAKHNKSSDCWIVISGKVYNVTAEISLHPGGASTITPYCGKDATKAFATKDKSSANNHSSFAQNLLTNYYLGDLNQKINQQDLNSAQQQINNNLKSNPGIQQQGEDEGEDEGEDD